MRLYSETMGSGPDLVLLHGWGMNVAVWSSIKPRLAERYRLTLVELPVTVRVNLTQPIVLCSSGRRRSWLLPRNRLSGWAGHWAVPLLNGWH